MHDNVDIQHVKQENSSILTAEMVDSRVFVTSLKKIP